ncbi:MAG: hypothetical protein J7M26_08235, partial [Armatimonadetes bacterium]|nr:hypothetical protein [Armatimonadota bacterium]
VLSYQRWKSPMVGLRGIDTDGDGKADGGFWQGRNVYGIGVYEFARRLRQRVGDRVLLLADGASPLSQRCFGQLNGIESEGWPNLRDWDFKDWSGGLNRHRFWQQHARVPAFSYVNHKYIEGQEGHWPKLPFSRHRLAFAAAQMMDAAVCYSFAPPGERGRLFPIWDELWGGAMKKPGWLGKPLGPARCLAKEQPDLLEGAGRRWPADFVRRWQGEHTTVAAEGGALRLEGDAQAKAVRATLKGLACRGEDLYVVVVLRAAARAGYPPEIPRLAWVGLAKPDTELVRREPPPRTGMCRRGGHDEPIEPLSGAQVAYRPSWTVGRQAREAYFCHPPYRGGKPGYVYWERDVTVPPHGRLKFAIGMGKLSPQRSDGVEFRVTLKPAGATGRPQTIFSKLYNEYRWEEHEVSLERWSGKKVTLRFIADCGPKDNTTTDHAAWADVRLLEAGKPERRVRPERHMTFVSQKPFESTFYFRPVTAPRVNLAIEVEGREPVWIESLTVHAAPDLQVREFEHGVVLANPSLHPATFDLARLFLGQTFHRLTASPLQDTHTNDGQPVGRRVTLGALDGLFLVKQ